MEELDRLEFHEPSSDQVDWILEPGLVMLGDLERHPGAVAYHGRVLAVGSGASCKIGDRVLALARQDGTWAYRSDIVLTYADNVLGCERRERPAAEVVDLKETRRSRASDRAGQ